jgi:uncharacterized coiled-coil DUF342 family protein
MSNETLEHRIEVAERTLEAEEAWIAYVDSRNDSLRARTDKLADDISEIKNMMADLAKAVDALRS